MQMTLQAPNQTGSYSTDQEMIISYQNMISVCRKLVFSNFNDTGVRIEALH